MPRHHLDDKNRLLEALLSEYNALYSLAEFRLSALDRRIPLVGSVLTGFLATTPVLPESSRILALTVVPISVVWLVRTTVNHARSFEDVLRALEVLESKINGVVGRGAIGFQATHPSRGAAVGGRTGAETVGAVVLAACLLLGVCLWMGLSSTGFGNMYKTAYALAVGAVAAGLMPVVWRWRTYHYLSRRAPNARQNSESLRGRTD